MIERWLLGGCVLLVACGGKDDVASSNSGVDSSVDSFVAADTSLDTRDTAPDTTTEDTRVDAAEDGPSCVSPKKMCAGECVDLKTNPAHCGTCDTSCCVGSVCMAGTCTLSCPAGMSGCTDPSSKCPKCVDLTTDPENCGTCGTMCSDGRACVAGKCG